MIKQLFSTWQNALNLNRVIHCSLMFRRNLPNHCIRKYLAVFLAMSFCLVTVDAAQLYWNYYNSYETCAADQPGKNFCNRISNNSDKENRSQKNCSFCQCNDPAEFLQLNSIAFNSLAVFEPATRKATVFNEGRADYSLLLFQELAPPS